MENRNKAREPVNSYFQYSLKDDPSEQQIKDAMVVDHSERGLRFESLEKLPVGAKLRLSFKEVNPPIQGLPLNAEGIVVWCVQPDSEESVYRTGLKYI